MIKGGLQRQTAQEYSRKDGTVGEFSKYRFKNTDISRITKAKEIPIFILEQQTNWISHCIRADDNTYIKQLTFPDYFKSVKKKTGVLLTTYGQVLKSYKSRQISENTMIKEMIKH